MKTVQFSVEFNVRDLMRDPEMRKALQEREQAYQKNMAWLDEDLNRRIREEEEKQRFYENNLVWLDDDLNKKLDQRHQENISWLDDDLNEKLEKRKRDLLQEIQTSSEVTETQPQRTPKIWHCGHGAMWNRPDSKVEKEKLAKFHDEGIRGRTCFIHTAHLDNDDFSKGRGFNTTKQFKKFLEGSKEGDIIFNHCAKKGGITHYGFFTGEVTQNEVQDEEDKLNNRTSLHNFIHVYEWFPLSDILKGAGRNSTLYEVKPTFKNYQNYSIPS